MQFSRDAQALAYLCFQSDSEPALYLVKTQLVKGPKQSEKSGAAQKSEPVRLLVRREYNTAAFFDIESCLVSVTSSPGNGGCPCSPVRPQHGRQNLDSGDDFLSFFDQRNPCQHQALVSSVASAK